VHVDPTGLAWAESLSFRFGGNEARSNYLVDHIELLLDPDRADRIQKSNPVLDRNGGDVTTDAQYPPEHKRRKWPT
jgi:hypothetical protein